MNVINEMMYEELKPCPFCGGEAVLISNDKEQLYSVECQSCDCGTCDHLGPEIAIDVWNRRVKE